MKKTILILVSFFLLVGYVGTLEHTYKREECEVIYIKNDEVRVEDKQGNVWSYYIENEEVKIGDIVTLKMHTNYTHNIIEDDIVKGVK